MSKEPTTEHDRDARRLTRRDFLGVSAGAAGAAATGGLGALVTGCASADRRVTSLAPPRQATPVERAKAPVGPLPKRTLGRTGLKITAFSMGAIGANVDVFKAGLDRGVNFIHCAQGYGTLDRVATAIAGRRPRPLLGLKYERAGAVDWDHLNRSLEALKVDHVEVLFFPLNTPEAARDRAHLEFFNQVKRQKKARFIGLTSHSNVAPTLQAAIAAGFWDVLMPSYPPSPQARGALRPVLEQAAKKKLGVVAMKTIGGIAPNALAEMRTAAAQVLADRTVTTLCKGVLTFELLDACLGAATAKPTRAESTALREHLVARQGETCFLCGGCPPCPRGVNIFEVVRDLDYYYAQTGCPQFARAQYRALPAAQRGGACDDCGECAAACPHGVNIARRVRAAELVLA
ncbi:MAG TPA: twin-arginine translocation signal domain-containing protein [Armatimonadota bacterium]|nr:twin-arginine translocation signal domain-containing protein [Armatimonadota bacterium]